VPKFILSLLAVLRVFLRSRSDTALEVLALGQQVTVLKRKRPRPVLNSLDRLFWITLCRYWTEAHYPPPHPARTELHSIEIDPVFGPNRIRGTTALGNEKGPGEANSISRGFDQSQILDSSAQECTEAAATVFVPAKGSAVQMLITGHTDSRINV